MAGTEKLIDLLEVEDFIGTALEPVPMIGPPMLTIGVAIPAEAIGGELDELEHAQEALMFGPGQSLIEVDDRSDDAVIQEVPVWLQIKNLGHDDSAVEPEMINTVVSLELDDGRCPTPSAPTPEEDVVAAYGTLILSDDASTDTTVTTAGTPVQAAGTFKLGEALLFGLSGSGLQYTGAVTRKFRVSFSGRVGFVSGTIPVTATLMIRKNGADIVIDTPDVLLDATATVDDGVPTSGSANTRDQNVSMEYILELAQNDILTLWFDASNNGDVISLNDGAVLVATALN